MKRERTRRAEPARGRRGRGAHRAAIPVLAALVALLLLGGALGLTIPSFFLIRRLLRKSGRSAACAPEQHSSAGR